LNLLDKLLAQDRKQMTEYSEFLVSTFEKTTNLPTQKRILAILSKFVDKKSFVEISNCLLRCLDSIKNQEFKQSVIENLISMIRLNHYELVEDFDHLLLEGIPKFCLHTSSPAVALKITQLIEVLRSLLVPEHEVGLILAH
jgi:Zn-dependent M16 (insulinase) family peptidase